MVMKGLPYSLQITVTGPAKRKKSYTFSSAQTSEKNCRIAEGGTHKTEGGAMYGI